MAAGHHTGKSLRNRAVRFSARGARVGFLILSLEQEDRLPCGSPPVGTDIQLWDWRLSLLDEALAEGDDAADQSFDLFAH